MSRPRTSSLILLIPVLLAWPRPARAELGAPFVDGVSFEALRAIQAQVKEVFQAARLQPSPLLIPDANFGDKKSVHYRYQRKDVIYFLDAAKRPIPIGWELLDVVETSGGEVERLMSVEGGDHLTPEGAAQVEKEKRKAADEGQRLAKLLADSGAKAKLQKSEKGDEDALEKMVGEFPRALQFTYEGVERGPDGEELVRESFESNACSHAPHVDPCFTPSSQEARIFEGMKGEIWIRARDKHLARLTTKILHDVKFGWGPFSAKAKAGGSIAVTLSDMDGKGRRWIVMDLEDHLLIEKSWVIGGGADRDNDDQVKRSFQTVGDMSFDQGIALLRDER
jgi:hypothetical protein